MELSNSTPEIQGITLVSGPSRGGKSRWAEYLVNQYPIVTYIATSPDIPNDLDWQNRLQEHRQSRPKHWHVVESGPNLVEVIIQLPKSDVILIDSLGAFVTCNLELSLSQWRSMKEDLLNILKVQKEPVVVVIEETGWGVVPDTSIGCLFRDRLGKLAQELEPFAMTSWLVLQGRALNLTELGIPVP